jgi:CPA1 family monovalent cation:H+ antiporter
VRHQLESLLTVLALGSAVAIGAKRTGIPYNVALVVIGLLAVFVDVLPHVSMDAELVLLVFLPVLVFEGAIFANAESLRRAARPILALALPGVALSLMGTAWVAHVAVGFPFQEALLLGALLAITDTVSVLLAFRSTRAPHRLTAIMEGESLFNDGTALVLVSITSIAFATGTFDGIAAARGLFVSILGGAAIGLAFGAVGGLVLRRTPDHLTAIFSTLVLVFATSLGAEHLHASPVIAVVVAGLSVGRAARESLEPSRILALEGFWETIGFSLNVLLFLLVGMEIQPPMLVDNAWPIFLALLALHAGRAVAVYACFLVLRLTTREIVPLRWQHVMVFGNIKGALSMAAVLALPPSLPDKPRLVAIVFGVTFVTLVTQALPFRRFLGLLGIDAAAGSQEQESARASLVAARRGQVELDELLATGLVSRGDHAERRAEFQRRIIVAEQTLRTQGGTDAATSLVADIALLEAQKAAVRDGARRGLYSDAAAAAHVEAIDRQLLSHHHRSEET